MHCGDIDLALRTFYEMSKPDNCGVDNVSYGTLLKVYFIVFILLRVLDYAKHC